MVLGGCISTLPRTHAATTGWAVNLNVKGKMLKLPEGDRTAVKEIQVLGLCHNETTLLIKRQEPNANSRVGWLKRRVVRLTTP